MSFKFMDDYYAYKCLSGVKILREITLCIY